MDGKRQCFQKAYFNNSLTGGSASPAEFHAKYTYRWRNDQLIPHVGVF